MSAASQLRYAYLAYFSRPKADRVLYRAVRKKPPRLIVELGVGCAMRSARLIELATQNRADAAVKYVGIDLFEARGSGTAGLSLKEAHRQLSGQGARIQLLPGDPYSALARGANALAKTDLLVIGADQDSESLERAWFFMPRMLHEGSMVFHEKLDATGQAGSFCQLSPADISKLAAPAGRGARHAA